VRIVRDGDMIALGRSLLLVGSHEDIDRRIAEVAASHAASGDARARRMRERLERIAAQQSDIVEDVADVRSPVLPSGPPPLPSRLSPVQSAELSELLEYVAAVLHGAAESVVVRPGQDRVELDFPAWQALLDLQASLAEMLRRIGDGEA